MNSPNANGGKRGATSAHGLSARLSEPHGALQEDLHGDGAASLARRLAGRAMARFLPSPFKDPPNVALSSGGEGKHPRIGEIQ